MFLHEILLTEGSPTRDRSPEPLLTKLYTGADMIRRKFVGSSDSDSPTRSTRLPSTRDKILLSRQEKRSTQRSLRLMEKVESIGLENIMHTSPRYHGGVGISPLALRSRTTSPMTQLTSLKNISHQKRRSEDPYAVDRETIKAVLNKGLSHESLLSDITTDGSTTSSVTSPSDRVAIDSKIKSNQDESTKTPQKIKQMQRQKSRRSLINGSGGGQRPDLGTVGPVTNISNQSTKQMNELDSDVSSVVSVTAQQSYTQSFVGSISSLFFGRKGGLL